MLVLITTVKGHNCGSTMGWWDDYGVSLRLLTRYSLWDNSILYMYRYIMTQSWFITIVSQYFQDSGTIYARVMGHVMIIIIPMVFWDGGIMWLLCFYCFDCYGSIYGIMTVINYYVYNLSLGNFLGLLDYFVGFSWETIGGFHEYQSKMLVLWWYIITVR